MKQSIKFLAMLVMVLAASVTLSSCDKDEPDTPTSQLVGTWLATDWTINGISHTDLELVFRSNGTGQITAKYPEGTDDDVFKFEYTTKTDSEGNLGVQFVWTGTKYILYEPGVTYKPVVTKTRMTLGRIDYLRK